MSGLLAEFMEKPVTQFTSGYKAMKAKNVLMQAFTASEERRKPHESAMFEEIVDSVMKTEKGRETMTTLSELGYSFAFEKGNFGGFCASDRKKIVLNPTCSFEYLLHTAVHEGRHAIQYSLEKQDVPAYEKTQVASFLRKHRALEADAVAHETAFIYECKKVLPKVYLEAQSENLPTLKAYESEMKKSGDERKAMQATFAAWYESAHYRQSYDRYHKDGIKKICDWGKQTKSAGYFTEEYPAKDVLHMCRHNGQTYMTEDFLNKGMAFAVSVQDRQEISAMLKDYAAATGTKADASISAMRTRSSNGALLPDNKAVNLSPFARAWQIAAVKKEAER